MKNIINNTEKEKNICSIVTDAINGSFSYKAFSEHMSREHRTLQYYFTLLCLEWLKKLREMYEKENYDGRNKHACHVGKILMDFYDNNF